MTLQNEKITPFYKEPLMILIAGIPVVAVILGVVILSLAISTKDSLVSDSYYKEGVSYTETIDAANKAHDLDIKGDIVFKNDEVHLNLAGNFDEEPNALHLLLIHPTLQDRDVTVFMQRMGPMTYAGVLENLPMPERRHIWLQNIEQEWRVRTTDVIDANKVIALSAQ